MPTRFLRCVTSTAGPWMSVPAMRMAPVMRTPSIRSFIRLRQRRRLDLPQPEGPMKAVTRFFAMRIEIPLRAGLSP